MSVLEELFFLWREKFKNSPQTICIEFHFYWSFFLQNSFFLLTFFNFFDRSPFCDEIFCSWQTLFLPLSLVNSKARFKFSCFLYFSHYFKRLFHHHACFIAFFLIALWNLSRVLFFRLLLFSINYINNYLFNTVSPRLFVIMYSLLLFCFSNSLVVFEFDRFVWRRRQSCQILFKFSQ